MPADIASRAGQDQVERRVCEIVERFVVELGVTPPRGVVTLGDSLDRDLGIGSLERVELLFRLEQTFGVRFPDTVVTEAGTPRDLALAVMAGGAVVPESMPAPVTPPGAGAPAPASARTLVDVLRWHAESSPERVHVVLRTDEGREQPMTYGSLWTSAEAVAAGLGERGVRAGQSVALMLRTEEAFFSAFFGILLAGAVPVPIYPPFRPDRIEEYAARQVRILGNAEARLLLTFHEAERVAGLLRSRVPSLRDVTTVESLARGADRSPRAALTEHAPALIQYTSGSTGDPKGVLLSHANILANIRALGQALDIRGGDVGVSWLPLYHDMGLIGMWLGSLYHAVPVVIMSPLAFLARPARWLWAIHGHRGTLSPAPNFAFDLCVSKVRDEEIQGLDLSCWRLALNGSEAVSPETIERFTARFGRYGFRPEAMCPVYGLAESSVGLTVSPPGRAPRFDLVARERFERTRKAEPAAGGERAPLRLVSCGRVLPDHEVRVVDAAGVAAPERVEGRIELRGPSVTKGYYRNPEATRAVVRGGWLDSGDLGYLADGELYLTGRRKDIIIKAGRNLYPPEIEEMVGDVPGVRKGCVAAFGVMDAQLGTERLVVVAESRQSDLGVLELLRAEIRERLVTALGIPPDMVVVCPPGSVQKTPSGKVRRSATREAFVRGDLARPRPSARTQWARLFLADARGRLSGLAHRAAALAFAAHVSVVVLLTVPVLWGLVVALPGGPMVDAVVRRWCRAVLALTGCRVSTEGLDQLPASGSVVFAANHSSYLDAVALLAALPASFRFVAKRELAAAPLIGAVIRNVGHLTVERADFSQSVADADRVTSALRGGTSLFVFPEGTFVRAPGLLPFKLGAFKAAVDAQCPVVPVTIRGTREILPADTWRPRPGKITLTIGTPLRPRAREWREIVRLRDETRAAIARHVTETD